MATTATPLICPQGHGPGVSGSRFCTFCGATLVVPAAPGQPASCKSHSGATPSRRRVAAGERGAGCGDAPTGVATSTRNLNTTAACRTTVAVSTNSGPAASSGCNSSGFRCRESATRVQSLRRQRRRPEAAAVICPECGWLRPLLPGYKLDRSVFLWAQDGQAMTKSAEHLRAPCGRASSVSDKVGRPVDRIDLQWHSPGPKAVPGYLGSSGSGGAHSRPAHHARCLYLGRFAVEHLYLRHRHQLLHRPGHRHPQQLPERRSALRAGARDGTLPRRPCPLEDGISFPGRRRPVRTACFPTEC